MIFRTNRIGLDIGSVRVKAAQGDRSGRVRRLASIPRLHPGTPIGQDEAWHIGETLMRQGFVPGPIVLACPPEQVRIEELDLPPIRDAAAIERVVSAELARITHWAPGTFEQAWWLIPAPSQSASGAALAAASTHSHAESFIEPFDSVGFDVEAVDLNPAATARACAARLAPEGLACAIDIGWRSSTLAVWIDAQLVFVRALPLSGVQSIAAALGLEPAEAATVLERLAQATDDAPWGSPALTRGFRLELRALGATLAAELERSYTYVARRFPEIECAATLVCGGGANLPGLVDGLCAGAGSRIVRATPGSLLEHGAGASRLADDPGLVAACGLMLWHEGGA